MNHLLRLLLVLLIASGALRAQDRYRVHFDIAGSRDGKLRVMIFPPTITEDSVTWVFPVSVPGTYEEHFWHRLVSGFRAYDSKSIELPVHRSVDSQFVVKQARNLRYVTYELDDSFDDTTGRLNIFAPAGTAFEKDSIFVLNHGGVVCYIDGMQK
ncbi:MAG: hypothetical protein FGM32_11220, partial [Candidatus Kapabacteria bacterium]|nr:hypothetical protein [Candidatus Kapabacteria bacterium]